ncbi:FG-GAP repeat domain-containing protein [Micromonospora chersina]|uniref:FG-GAP repeat domain-containing protein n=1 Tax=Micromonospora chersina TaxID=47854 RepID=UPI0033D3493A
MSSSSNRRGRRLAAALVAAGLALSAAPPALADDDNGLLVLTDSQAQDLERHAQLDVYGDGGETVDPLHLADSAAVPGTGSDDRSAATGDTAATGGLSLAPRSVLTGVSGMADTRAVGGTAGDYFTVHSLATVQRTTADGSVLWRRDSPSLYADWKVTPLRPGQKEPYPARVLMGFNAVSPFTIASDNGYVTGDLTGDGVDDLVFTASVGSNPYRPFTSPGSTLPTGTFVTVLDGATGVTLWSRLYAAADNVALVGRTLVIADSPYVNINSPADSRTALTGIRFDYAGGVLTPAESWTYDAGPRTGLSWASLEPLGGGLLAASWNLRKNGTITPGRGHTLVIDTTGGSVRWSADHALYSRQLHLDAGRGRLVALEQSDPIDGVQYQLAAYDLADGARTHLDTRINALPLAMIIGDLQGDDRPEYAVSEATLDSGLWINASTVRALDGTTPATALWQRTIKRAPGNGRDGSVAWGLKVVDGRLVASYLVDDDLGTADNRGGRKALLSVLAGNNGSVRWEQRGVLASPAFAQPFQDGDDWHLRTVDTDQNLRTYGLGSGSRQGVLPLQGELSSAVSTDVNGDGKQDLVVGGQSNGLWAYDGPSLAAGTPRLLWQTTLPGQNHRIVKADTDGNGRDELVVAADIAAVVVDPRTGRILSRIDGAGQFVWSVTAADTDGDHRAEVLIPTDKLRVYRAGGTKVWEYAAPAGSGDVVFSDASVADGHVYVQYGSRGATAMASVVVNGVALDAANGSVSWTANPVAPTGTDGKLYAPVLHGGTFASPAVPYADGHAVVFVWASRNVVLRNVVEIRDGRTGEVLHQALAGGYGGLGNWLTAPEGLVMGSTYAVRLYAPGGDRTMNTNQEVQTAAFATGPNGRRLLVAGGTGGLGIWDGSVLAAGQTYVNPIASLELLGARSFFTGDLDGDGVDEVVSLNFDATGWDRMLALAGAGYSTPYTAVRQMTVATLSGS